MTEQQGLPEGERGQEDSDLLTTLPQAPPRTVHLARHAANSGWPVTPELRATVLQGATEILANLTDRRWIAAAKIVLLADSLNVRREATSSAESIALLTSASERLRSALSDPRTRKALAALTDNPVDTTTSPADSAPSTTSNT